MAAGVEVVIATISSASLFVDMTVVDIICAVSSTDYPTMMLVQ